MGIVITIVCTQLSWLHDASQSFGVFFCFGFFFPQWIFQLCMATQALVFSQFCSNHITLLSVLSTAWGSSEKLAVWSVPLPASTNALPTLKFSFPVFFVNISSTVHVRFADCFQFTVLYSAEDGISDEIIMQRACAFWGWCRKCRPWDWFNRLCQYCYMCCSVMVQFHCEPMEKSSSLTCC